MSLTTATIQVVGAKPLHTRSIDCHTHCMLKQSYEGHCTRATACDLLEWHACRGGMQKRSLRVDVWRGSDDMNDKPSHIRSTVPEQYARNLRAIAWSSRPCSVGGWCTKANASICQLMVCLKRLGLQSSFQGNHIFLANRSYGHTSEAIVSPIVH